MGGTRVTGTYVRDAGAGVGNGRAARGEPTFGDQSRHSNLDDDNNTLASCQTADNGHSGHWPM